MPPSRRPDRRCRMSTATTIDAARLNLLLNELRLPAIKVLWPQFAEQSDKEGWPASRFLAVIAEHEIAERGRRRIERHLVEARLPTGKTFDSYPRSERGRSSPLGSGQPVMGGARNSMEGGSLHAMARAV